MNKYILRLFFVSFAFIVLITDQSKAAVIKDKGVESFLYSISTDVLSVLNNPHYSRKERESNLERIFENTVDIDWIGRFVLGVHWKRASEQQRTEYLKYYGEFLKFNYVGRFKSYTNQKLNIINVEKLDKEGEYLVETEITSEDAQSSIGVDYKIRKKEGRYQVYDIAAEGVSLITTQRADFNTILSRRGIDYLTSRLKQRVESN